MDYNDSPPAPPRKQRDPRQRAPTADNFAIPQASSRPQRSTMPQSTPIVQPNVSFQEPERTWRSPPPTHHNTRPPLEYSKDSFTGPVTPGDAETGFSNPFSDSGFRRKKSLIHPDREKIDPGHRQWHYRQHAAQMEEEQYADPSAIRGMAIGPSTTGNMPQTGLRRGKSLLARDEDVQETRINMFARGATLRRKRHAPSVSATATNAAGPGGASTPPKTGLFKNIAPGPVDVWMIYCWFLTICIPPFLLRVCGMLTPERQRAWREKMGLISIIVVAMAGVGFLTFGFNQTVCGTPPNRYLAGTIDKASIIVNGFDYDFSHFQHPAVSGVFTGKQNPLYEGGWNAAGMDLSFMFQYRRGSCRNVITAAPGSAISQTSGLLDWMFPCNIYNQWGTSTVNLTGYDNSTACHIKTGTQALVEKYQPSGQVYYTWSNVTDDNRNLAVYESMVLDLNLLNWLDTSLVRYPSIFNDLKKKNGTFNKHDVTMWVHRNNYQEVFQCLKDTVTVGFIDADSIGCVASQVVLYLSLVFIIGVVGIRFCMAVIFGWFVSYKIGAFTQESYSQRMQRAAEIENWTDNIYRPAPSRYRPSVALPAKGGASKANQFLPKTSRFSRADNPRPVTTYGAPEAPYRRTQTNSAYGAKGLLSPTAGVDLRSSRSSMSLPSVQDRNGSICPFPLHNVIPQPPPDFEPFNFPLLHSICLVTAYSESLEGLRTTLDSLATTDYPNSHKLIMVIADGMVKGQGNSLTTPEIVLSMMKELVVPIDEVDAHSYVSIADGHKRHNMAKVYAGFYDYDDNTVEPSKQQRVPVVLVAKTGNPLETNDPKPGNRGKRDSQMVLMSFLQKVMFDERMTTMEFDFFNSIWRCTGLSPDRYEVVLCVDADTKVFPDSLTRMAACMVHDEEIMGLCGETKIANKSETWVTMIQVFEYYISHHLTKAFESMFGGVTCLPGCFSMYRIKVPKGSGGYWVPILANPDVVEHYSENIVDTLHKKNLLLLGEDRYLTTLMLKTFPKRKMIFCPQAVCKTVVPDTFSVLLSQRRRWINSTVHNLAELLLVRDLCGTFCFSMQFVVGMELIGTLVLPAAISFTLYLIIQTIIPGGPNTTISLILLAIILGLPGLLIVITSRKVAYIGWMLVYLISLPIWNFALPAYAYWHFDDFSWGQTRKALGDDDDGHGDKQGEFDSSHIIMKRWAEFERDRRGKPGMTPHELGYDVVHRNSSPKRIEHRYSLGSTAETYNDNASASRSSQQPMVPTSQDNLEAPRTLHPGGNSLRGSSPSNSSDGFGGAAPVSGGSPYDDTEPIISSYTRQRQESTPPHLRSGGSHYPQQSGTSYHGQSPQTTPYDQQRGGYMYSPTTPASTYTTQPTSSSRHAEAEALPPVQGLPRPSRPVVRRQTAQPAQTTSQSAAHVPAGPPTRGYTLTDPGVVNPTPGPPSVRRVSRNSKRSTTTPTTPAGYGNAPSPPPSNSSHGGHTRRATGAPAQLPPGAAPPQYPRYG